MTAESSATALDLTAAVEAAARAMYESKVSESMSGGLPWPTWDALDSRSPLVDLHRARWAVLAAAPLIEAQVREQVAREVGSGASSTAWQLDVEDRQEGGQPNGAGEIESSEDREWFRPERETHHRRVITHTLVGPWEPGPTDSAARAQQRAEMDRLSREERTLREADEIRARRGDS